MPNILLVHPYIISSTPVLYLNEPIGLLCLATYLKELEKDKVNVDLLDLYALGYNSVKKIGDYYSIGISDPQTIVRLVRQRNPDIIGITCNFTTYTNAVFDIANLLKTNFPQSTIVIGGAHATMDSENVLNKCRADVVVKGEGEITFHSLVSRIDSREGFSDLLGITYRENGTIVSNPPRPLMDEINSLPIPDRKYINQEIYSKINTKMYFLSRGRSVASIITSRGCPYNCVFCSTKIVWERKFRPRPAESVVDEMQSLMTDYSIDEFIINDDQFFFNKARVEKICDLIAKKNLKLSLNVASGSSVWLLDEGLLKKLKQSGLYRITLPIESGSYKTLKYIKKPVNLEETKKLICMANHLGIWTYANFIIGFPYERFSDIQDTINYAYHSGLDNATFFIAKPYAGSEMYETFKQEGLLKNEDRPTTMGEAGFDIMHMSASELQKIRDRAQRGYFLVIFLNYINPFFFFKYVYPKINRLRGLRYFIKIIKNSIWHFLIQPIYQRAIVSKN